MDEHILKDFAGFRGWARYTHIPSGDTLVRQPYMSADEWYARKAEWLAKYPDMPIQDERGQAVNREE